MKNYLLALKHSILSLWIPFLLTAFLFLLLYVFFGFYLVDYEGLNTAFFTGKLSPGFPFRSLYFSGNIGISYFYSILYDWFPGVEWLSIFQYSCLFFCSLLINTLLYRRMPGSLPIPLRILFMLLIGFFVFADHAVHLLYTRVAYMVCGVSLMGVISIWHEGKAKESKSILLIYYSFFTVGLLIRLEAAMAVLALFTIFASAYFLNFKDVVKILALPGVLVVFLFLYLIIDINLASDREFYKQVEPDIEEQFIARENRIPLSYMKTHRDSVKYMAAADMMWSDPKEISVKYLRSLLRPEAFFFTDAKQWTRVWVSIKEIFILYWYLIILALFLSVNVIITIRKQKGFKRWVILAFGLSFWVLTVLQTYTDKLNERSFMPLLSLYILCCSFYLLERISPYKKMYVMTIFLFLFFAGTNAFYLSKNAKQLAQARNELQEDLSKIKRLTHDKTLIINSTVFDYFFLSQSPFVTYDFSGYKRMYITDGYIIPFLPYYKGYLEQECSCDIYEFPSFWRYVLSLPRNEVVILSQVHRIEVVRSYLKTFYDITLPIQEERSIFIHNDAEKKDPNSVVLYYLE